MAGFTWKISIYKSGGGYMYDPADLKQVRVGDQIIWSNKDDRPHWPGRVIQTADGETTIDNTYFMAHQIAPHSPSDPFVPTAGNLTYVDSLDPNGPTGTIEVSK